MTGPSPLISISVWRDTWLNRLAAGNMLPYADAYARDVDIYRVLSSAGTAPNPPDRHHFRSFLASQQAENMGHATLARRVSLCAIFISLVRETAMLKASISAG